MKLHSQQPVSLGYAGLFYVHGTFVPEVKLYRRELRWWLVEFFRGEGFHTVLKHDPLALWFHLMGNSDN